jgi:multidrug transporter EmrE-like cation transporter
MKIMFCTHQLPIIKNNLFITNFPIMKQLSTTNHLYIMKQIPIIKNIPLMKNILLTNHCILVDNYDIFLICSILLETISTIFIKKTNSNKLWFIPVYSGYFISFFLFPKCLDKYSLSVAYTLWCGFGVLSTNIVDVLFFNQVLTIKKIIGSLLVISGSVLIK